MEAGAKNSSKEHSSSCRRMRVSGLEVVVSGSIMQIAAINMLFVELSFGSKQMHQALADAVLGGTN